MQNTAEKRQRHYITIIRDLLIGILIGVAMVASVIGASIQYQDRSVAMATVEVQG